MAIVQEGTVRGQEDSGPAGTKEDLMCSSWYHIGLVKSWHL